VGNKVFKDSLPVGFPGCAWRPKPSSDAGGPKPKGAMWVLQNVLVGLLQSADPDAGIAQVRSLLELAQGTVEYAQMMLWEVEHGDKAGE